MNGGSSSGAADPPQELRQLSDLSPLAGSSGAPSITIESETGARRPRPRARGRPDTDGAQPPPPTAASEQHRDKHAAKGASEGQTGQRVVRRGWGDDDHRDQGGCVRCMTGGVGSLSL